MSFQAGEVYAVLGGKLDTGAFRAFDAQMKQSAQRAGFMERSLKQSMSAGQKSLDTFKRTAATTAKVGILGLAGALAYSVKKAADFEQQISRLGAATNANGKQLERLKKQAMDAGAATKYSALEAAAAQTELAKGGLSVSKILGGGLKGALALAAAGELELADAASYTVNALNLFKLSGREAGHVADALATAANTTTADVQDFGAALVQGGGAARSAGYSFDETITILEALAESGVKNSDAGTSMKTALLQLIGPTEKQAAAAKEAGIGFLNQAGEMKGIGAISGMLRARTEDMTDAQRTQLFQTLAGTDGFRTLLALYDAGPQKLKRLETGLKEQGTAADTASKKQDNLKGALETMQGSLETAAITVGTALIPMLRDGAENLTEFINEAQKSGDIEDFAQGLVRGIEDVVNVAGDMVDAIGDIAGAVAPVAGALDGLIPGDLAHNLAGAAAGLLAFKGATGIAAGIASLGTPLGAARLAAIGLGIALSGLMDKESAETQVAKGLADMKREQADAIQAVQDAIAASADTGLAAERAQLSYRQELAALNDLKEGTKAYREQKLAVREASLRVQQTQDANVKAIDAENESTRKAVDDAKERASGLRDLITQLQFMKKMSGDNKDITAALEKAQAGLNDVNQEYLESLALQQTSEVSRQRLMQQADAITKKNADGIARLIQNFKEVPQTQQSKLLLDNQDALADAGRLTSVLNRLGQQRTVTQILANAQSATGVVGAFKAVLATVPTKTVTQILADADSGRSEALAFKAILAGVPASKVTQIVAHSSGTSEISQLKALIDSLHDKTVTVYNRTINTPGNSVTEKHAASGRAAGAREPALIGEGANPHEYVINRRTGEGYVTGGPMMTTLGADDYVIPLDQRFRSGALGLWQSLARDLGVPGFKEGRKPRPRYALGGVPFGDVEQQWFQVRDRYQQAQHDKNAKDKFTRDPAQALLANQKFVNRYEQLKADYPAARRTNEHALGLQSDINVLADQMELADRKGNKGLFRKLRGQRANKIENLQGLLRKALKSPARSQSKRDILEQLARLKVDLFDTRHDKPTPADTPAEKELSAYTKKEREQIEALQAYVALAETTTETGDDQFWLSMLLGVQQGALDRAVTSHAAPAILQEAAQAVSSTKSALKNLTGASDVTGGAGPDADLQAQLEQANERLRVSQVENQIQGAALKVYGGGGSGTVINQTNNMLVPGSPETMIAVGRAAVGGISHQQTRTPSRVKAGF